MTFKHIVFLFIVLSVLSCQKNNNTSVSYQEGVESSQSFVSGQHLTTLLLNTYFKSIADSLLMVNGYNNIDGANVTFESNGSQKLTFSYSNLGGNDGYGHWRVGTYEAVTATSFDDPEAIVNFDFADFAYVYKKSNPQSADDTLRVGQLSISNLGEPNGKDNQYLVEADSSIYYYGDSTGILIFDMDQYFELIKAPGTVYYSEEDKFNIWGLMTGNTANNYIFEANISQENSIRNEFTCDWLKRGPTIINTEKFKFESIVCFPATDSCQNEFLSDSCQNQYLIIIDQNPFPFPFDD